MKTLLFLSCFLLSGCSCIISQTIPTQRIFSDENGCSAPLPNYLPLFHVADNCEINSFIQTPAPGFILDANNMIVRVIVSATDKSGNNSQRSFDVMLIDTISPQINVADSILFTSNYDVLEALYTQADKILEEELNNFDSNFPYEKLGLPVADGSWYTDYLIYTSAPPDSITGIRDRVWSFWNPENDSIPITAK